MPRMPWMDLSVAPHTLRSSSRAVSPKWSPGRSVAMTRVRPLLAPLLPAALLLDAVLLLALGGSVVVALLAASTSRVPAVTR